jgi:hypothetical protein
MAGDAPMLIFHLPVKFKRFPPEVCRGGERGVVTKMTFDEFLLPKTNSRSIANLRSSMIAIQAMQVPRWSGGLLRVPSGERQVHSKKKPSA